MQSYAIDPQKYPGLAKWVTGSLVAHKKQSDIIFQLCKQTGWDWKLAQQFVVDVSENSQKEIHVRRAPLLIGIGLLFMVTGIVSTISSILDLNSILAGIQLPIDIATIINIVFQARDGYLAVAGLVYGVAAIVGGSVGVWSAMSAAMTGGEKVIQEPHS